MQIVSPLPCSGANAYNVAFGKNENHPENFELKKIVCSAIVDIVYIGGVPVYP